MSTRTQTRTQSTAAARARRRRLAELERQRTDALARLGIPGCGEVLTALETVEHLEAEITVLLDQIER